MSDPLPPYSDNNVARVIFLIATAITGACGWLSALNSSTAAATGSYLMAAALAFGLGAVACPKRK